jgi:molybdenum cofactor guanylyltransferase
MKNDVAVVILAGGEGRRIGGGKPLKALCGKHLINHAIERAHGFSELVAVAVRDELQVEPIEAILLEDETDVEGPLGGLIAGLKFAGEHDREFTLAIPSDMPFLPADMLTRLAGAICDHGCALASSGGHVHPVCGLWRTSSLQQIEAYIETDRRSLRGFAELIGSAVVEWRGGFSDPFFNINTKEHLAQAERRPTG